MLSAQSKYALRAMIYLSERQKGAFIKAERIAHDTKLPAAYLSKILKQLQRSKILTARRGKNGGVQLSQVRARISFYDICVAMQDPIVRAECVLFKKECNKNSPCSFHSKWSATKVRMIKFLKATYLQKERESER